MATLSGNTIASTYLGVLSVSGAVGADTVEAVTDGAGTSTSLSLRGDGTALQMNHVKVDKVTSNSTIEFIIAK